MCISTYELTRNPEYFFAWSSKSAFISQLQPEIRSLFGDQVAACFSSGNPVNESCCSDLFSRFYSNMTRMQWVNQAPPAATTDGVIPGIDETLPLVISPSMLMELILSEKYLLYTLIEKKKVHILTRVCTESLISVLSNLPHFSENNQFYLVHDLPEYSDPQHEAEFNLKYLVEVQNACGPSHFICFNMRMDLLTPRHDYAFRSIYLIDDEMPSADRVVKALKFSDNLFLYIPPGNSGEAYQTNIDNLTGDLKKRQHVIANGKKVVLLLNKNGI